MAGEHEYSLRLALEYSDRRLLLTYEPKRGRRALFCSASRELRPGLPPANTHPKLQRLPTPVQLLSVRIRSWLHWGQGWRMLTFQPRSRGADSQSRHLSRRTLMAENERQPRRKHVGLFLGWRRVR